MGMPRLIQPMMASLRHGCQKMTTGVGGESKRDGVRVIAHISGVLRLDINAR